jgi:hypothetical protein
MGRRDDPLDLPSDGHDRSSSAEVANHKSASCASGLRLAAAGVVSRCAGPGDEGASHASAAGRSMDRHTPPESIMAVAAT